MIVRLKECLPASVCLSILYGFNSMIVRLKDESDGLITKTNISFNSMIVRLKVRTPKPPRRAGGFQFYDSPIKSHKGNAYKVRKIGFQFYDSPIKRFFKTMSMLSVVNVSIL